MSERIEITTAGVKQSLKNYTEIEAIIEYIWNGFDAEASSVHINFEENEMGGVKSISIIDNGTGINFSLLKDKFKPFFQSEKSRRK